MATYLFKPCIEEREPLYKKYLFDVETKPSLVELCEKVKRSKGIVLRDLAYFALKYDVSFDILSNEDIDKVQKSIEVKASGFKEREAMYKAYFIAKGYVPFKSEIARDLGIRRDIVCEDLKYMGIESITQKEFYDTFGTSLQQRAIERESFYKENYFYADNPLSLNDMAEILGDFKQTIHKEIQFLATKYGVSISDVANKRKVVAANEKIEYYREFLSAYFKKKGYIPPVLETCRELNLGTTLVNWVYKNCDFKPLKASESYLSSVDNTVKERKDFYNTYYFNTDNSLTTSELSKRMGLSLMTVNRDIHKYGAENIQSLFEEYRAQKDGLDYSSKFNLRKRVYDIMVKAHIKYPITHLCKGFSCHYDVVNLDMKKLGLREKLIKK